MATISILSLLGPDIYKEYVEGNQAVSVFKDGREVLVDFFHRDRVDTLRTRKVKVHKKISKLTKTDMKKIFDQARAEYDVFMERSHVHAKRGT